MIALRLAAAGGSAALGWLGEVITAISGLIATIGGLFLATRRKPMDPQDVALLALAERLTRDEEPDEQA